MAEIYLRLSDDINRARCELSEGTENEVFHLAADEPVPLARPDRILVLVADADRLQVTSRRYRVASFRNSSFFRSTVASTRRISVVESNSFHLAKRSYRIIRVSLHRILIIITTLYI